MPTFFEGLKRMLSGQPVFKPGEGVDGVTHKDEQYNLDAEPLEQPAAPSTDEKPVERQGPKVIPQTVIQQTECRTNGANMELTIQVQNLSRGNIMLDKILLFGNTRELDYTLDPGKMEKFQVYNGSRPNNRNSTHCELYYRDELGDYFSAVHNVEFEQEPDGTYKVSRIRFLPPVKDI